MELSNFVNKIINNAKKEVRECKYSILTDEYLLFNLFRDSQYHLLGKCMAGNNFNLFTFRFYIDSKTLLVGNPDYIDIDKIELSEETKMSLDRAREYAEQSGADKVDAPHLLLALLESNNNVVEDYLRDYAIPVEALRLEVIELMLTGSIEAYDKNYKVENNNRNKKQDDIL